MDSNFFPQISRLDSEFQINEFDNLLNALEPEEDSALNTSMQNSPEGQNSNREGDSGPNASLNMTQNNENNNNHNNNHKSLTCLELPKSANQKTLNMDDSMELIDNIEQNLANDFRRLDSSGHKNDDNTQNNNTQNIHPHNINEIGHQVSVKLMAHNERTSGVKSIYNELIKEIDELGVDKMGLDSNSNSMNGSVYIASQVPKIESNREVTMPVPSFSNASRPIKLESTYQNNHNNSNNANNNWLPNPDCQYTVKERTQYIVEAIPKNPNNTNSDNASNIPPFAQYKYTVEKPARVFNSNNFPDPNNMTNFARKPEYFHQAKSKSTEFLNLPAAAGPNHNYNNYAHQPYITNDMNVVGSKLSKSGPIRPWKTTQHTPRVVTPYGRSRPGSPSRITPNLINYEKPNMNLSSSMHGSNNSVNSMGFPGGHATSVSMQFNADGTLRTSPMTGKQQQIRVKKEAKNVNNSTKDKEDRPFRCQQPSKKDPTKQCTSAFKRADELKRHMKIHNPNKPYKCQYCPMTFSRTDHLTTHTRTHTKEKPYPCQYDGCDKRFARSDERLRHHAVHENRKKKEAMKIKEEQIKKENQARASAINQKSILWNNPMNPVPTITANGQYNMTTSMMNVPNSTGTGRLTPNYPISLPNSLTNSMNITYPPTPAGNLNSQSPMNSGYVTPNNVPVFGTPYNHSRRSPINQQNSSSLSYENSPQINYNCN